MDWLNLLVLLNCTLDKVIHFPTISSPSIKHIGVVLVPHVYVCACFIFPTFFFTWYGQQICFQLWRPSISMRQQTRSQLHVATNGITLELSISFCVVFSFYCFKVYQGFDWNKPNSRNRCSITLIGALQAIMVCSPVTSRAKTKKRVLLPFDQ